MKKLYSLENLKRPYVSVFLVTVFLSYSVILLISYYSVKILSIKEKYYTEKSRDSKSQKEEALHKTICFSKNLVDAFFITQAVNELTIYSILINKLAAATNEVPRKTANPFLVSESRQKVFYPIAIYSGKLLITGTNPVNAPNDEDSSKAVTHLVIINIFFILLIIGSLGVYYTTTVKRLMRSKKETDIQNDNLRIANKELDRVVYSVSHDLRSPILSVKGLIEIAQEEENVSKIKEYLTMMDQSLTLQNQFITDVIDYCRNKRNQVCIESVDLNRLIDEVIGHHQHMKEAHTITFKKNIMAEEIITDGLRIRIILNNLISNAIKYSDAKKESKQISIKTYEKNSSYVIEIEDNGIGIKKEFLGQIFDMFFVTDNAMGTGLGLYITKEATEYLHGNISANSEENIGTTFTVTIPKAS